MDYFITIAVIVGLWLFVVLGGFQLITGLRKGRTGSEGVLVRVLWLIFIALAGGFYLFASPARPSFGNTVFLIVTVLVCLAIAVFAILAFRSAGNSNNDDNKES